MAGDSWDLMIENLPGSHLLQTSEWAEVKREVGWQSHSFTWKDENGKIVGAANLLIRSMRPLGIGPKMSVGYIPRGPMLDWNNLDLSSRVMDELESYARKSGLIFIKIDPEVELGRGIPGSETAVENPAGQTWMDWLTRRGWQRSREQIQFKNTAILDLSGSEDEWLKRMKQKARYNLRLAQKSDVTVRIATETELNQLYFMYAQTAARDGFIIREEEYYLDVWKQFIQAKMADPLIAEVDGKIVAGLVLFHFGKRAWYLYGMSSPLHREKMPNYLLQWEAMRLARSHGCDVYDLWGAPDEFNPKDSMFGVFRFKDGLGATVVRTSGAWDFTVRPGVYFLYQKILPKILDFTRALRRGKIKQEIN